MPWLIKESQEHCQEVDDYIAGFEAPVQERLEAVDPVLGLPPDAARSWRGAPNVLLKRISHLQFAAYKKHLGFHHPATLDIGKGAVRL